MKGQKETIEAVAGLARSVGASCSFKQLPGGHLAAVIGFDGRTGKVILSSTTHDRTIGTSAISPNVTPGECFAHWVRCHAARRGEWNDVAAVLDWLGSADLSCPQINPHGPESRAEHLLGYNENSFRMSDLNCRAVRWKPSLCPRTRDHPVGFGHRNYLLVVKHAHGAACSQIAVERMIKTTSVEFSPRIQKL
jgi:hypothetical protein